MVLVRVDELESGLWCVCGSHRQSLLLPGTSDGRCPEGCCKAILAAARTDSRPSCSATAENPSLCRACCNNLTYSTRLMRPRGPRRSAGGARRPFATPVIAHPLRPPTPPGCDDDGVIYVQVYHVNLRSVP